MNTLAYMYDWLTVEQISQFKAVWFGNSDHPAYQDVRTKFPDIKILRYHSGIKTIDPASGIKPKDQQSYFDWNICKLNPNWFLLRDRDKPSEPSNWINDAESGWTSLRYYLDPGNESFRAYAIAEMLSHIEIDTLHPQYNFSGLALDNVRIGTNAKFNQYPNWTYAVNPDGFTDAYLDFIANLFAVLKGQGYFLAINHTLKPDAAEDSTWWARLGSICDIAMREVNVGNCTFKYAMALAEKTKLTWLYGFGDNSYETYQKIIDVVQPIYSVFVPSDKEVAKQIII